MSTIKTNAVQIGQSVTATNNFTFYQPAVPDGTVRIANGNAGAATDAITIGSNGFVTLSNGISANGVGVFSGNVSGVNGTFTGAVSGTDGTFSGNVQMASANGGQLAGLRNKIINGNMGIFQRGTTAVTTNNTFGPPDRWRTNVVGDTFSTSQGSFVSGDTLYDTGGAQYFTQIAVTSVANAANFCVFGQPIEDVRILAGQTVTVSFWAKAASGTPSIGLSLDQEFAAGGSTVVNGTGQAQALTTTWTKYTKTFSIPSINGKTISTTATSFTILYFWLDAGSSNDNRSGFIGQASKTVSIAQVQLEVGPVATPFEQRPIGMELALCQRYFQAGVFVNDVGALNGTTYYAAIRLKVTMRISPPTVTFTNPNVYAGAGGALVFAATNQTVPDNMSADTVGVVLNLTTQPQAACRILGGTYTASAEL